MVSPENSEDGNLPPVGEFGHEVGSLPVFQQTPGALTNQLPSTQSTAQIYSGLAPAPVPNVSGFPQLQLQQNMMMAVAPSSTPMVFHQHAGNPTGSAQKRQRIDQPSSGGVHGQLTTQNGSSSAMAALPNGQQLAEAAAQAMEIRSGRKGKSQVQVDRRRERNRILARRTRLRKKFFFESLQKEVMDLQQENLELKELVRQNVDGEEGKKILDSCSAAEKLPPAVLEACGEQKLMDSKDFNLVRSIQQSQHSFIITDPSLTDNPIIFASDDFLKLTGYAREQVLGRNCRFLQGTDTNKETVDNIRRGLSNGDDVSVTIINYTADGTPFWNNLFIAALRDAQNNIVNFIGVSVKVEGPEPGHPEHGTPLPTQKSKEDSSTEKTAERTIMAIEDSVNAAVAAVASAGPQ
jgi:PAS domain S-box-containing protein